MRPSTNISRFEEQLGYWRTKYPIDFIYDNEKRPTSLRYNGAVNRTDFVYDALGRIASRNAVLNNASYLSSYAYDDNGIITSAIYKGQTIGCVYDVMGHLVRVNDQVNRRSSFSERPYPHFILHANGLNKPEIRLELLNSVQE